jgi:hypothetical protein
MPPERARADLGNLCAERIALILERLTPNRMTKTSAPL